jgi:proline dehydrogenase
VDRLSARLRELPAHVLRVTLIWISRRRALGRLATRLPIARQMVARFVSGETLDAALEVVERLHQAGYRTTVDVLGESVASPAQAEAAAARYVATLEALASRGLDGNVSLKPSQMGILLGPELCRANVGRVAEAAQAVGAFVRVDMEDHVLTEPTLELVRDLRATVPDVGVVIQSYLRRSAADVERLIDEGTRVRLCKGAYDEPAGVAFQGKREVDESFVLLAERLLAEGTFPALATHDERAIEACLGFAARHGIEASRYEFQMLYGVRRDLQERLSRDGIGVRVYVPFGTQWYPYFMRRLAERPANVLFFLRSMLREGR